MLSSLGSFRSAFILLLGCSAAWFAPAPAVSQDPPTNPPRNLPIEQDPIVLSVQESNPQTPKQLTRAIQIMLDIGRSDQAKIYLEQLTSTATDDTTLFQLQREFGSALFLRMIRAADLRPAGKDFGQRVLDTSNRVARSPERIDGLVRQLADTSPSKRRDALAELKRLNELAVMPLMQVIRDPNRADEAKVARYALVQLGSAAIEPLTGCLNSSDLRVRIAAIQALGQLNARSALPQLLKPLLLPEVDPQEVSAANDTIFSLVGRLPSRAQAQAILHKQIQRALQSPRVTSDFYPTVVLWQWDPNQDQCVANWYDPSLASLIEASDLAHTLSVADQSDRQALKLYFLTYLGASKLVGGLHQPISGVEPVEQVIRSDIHLLEEVLTMAIQSGHEEAAIGAVEVLGRLGDASLVVSKDGRPRAIVRALRHSNRRLRFFAAQAILRLDPRKPFPGCSDLPKTLAYMIGSSGDRQVLIGHPRPQQAQVLAGMLDQLGFRAQVVTGGRALLTNALRHSDYEMIFMSATVDRPPTRELLQQLRRDPRTAQIPIGLLAHGESLKQLSRFVEDDPLTEAFAWPADLTSASAEVHRLISIAKNRLVGGSERLNQAVLCMDGMLRLAADPETYTYYDPMQFEATAVEALENPELADRAIKWLELIASPTAQRTLINYASLYSNPLETRQAAARGFAAAVQRRGIMLTTQEILTQYDRYNQSESADRPTQLVLGSILDSIESRNGRSGGLSPHKPSTQP